MRSFLLLLPLLVLASPIVQAQTGTPKLSSAQQKMIDDMKKKAEAEVKKLGMPIDLESTFPSLENDIKAPQKDLKRLSLLPSQAPSNAALKEQVSQMKKKLLAAAPKNIANQVTNQSATHSAEELQALAAIHFFKSPDPELGKAGDPVAGVLYAMESAEKLIAETETEIRPNEIQFLSNLAGYLNMVKLEHKAVPILQNCLKRMPNHSLALNNMGQAYLGLGELVKAKYYLQQSLSIDAMNPEANHSMGILYLLENLPDQAFAYFNKELETSMRAATLELYGKHGKEQALAVLRNKLAKNGKDHFEEINLGKFAQSMPAFPQKSDDVLLFKEQLDAYGTLINKELQKWFSYQIPEAEVQAEGRRQVGLNETAVNILLDDLHNEFFPEYLSTFTPDDFSYLKELDDRMGKQWVAAETCETQKAILDQWTKEHNDFVKNRLDIAIVRWKSYLNQLIHWVNKAPTGGNKLLTYRAVSTYFGTIAIGLGQVMRMNPPPACNMKLSPEEANYNLLTALLNFKCPKEFYLHLPLEKIGVDIKVNCEKFEIEGGGAIAVTGTYEFGSKNTTLAFGPNLEGGFFNDFIKGGVKEQMYVTWGPDKHVADVGLKVEVGGEIKYLGKIDGGYTIGVIAGYQQQAFSGTGIFTLAGL